MFIHVQLQGLKIYFIMIFYIFFTSNSCKLYIIYILESLFIYFSSSLLTVSVGFFFGQIIVSDE